MVHGAHGVVRTSVKNSVHDDSTRFDPGDEPDLHEHGWGSEKEVAKSGPWKLDPIKNSVYKTHPKVSPIFRRVGRWIE